MYICIRCAKRSLINLLKNSKLTSYNFPKKRYLLRKIEKLQNTKIKNEAEIDTLKKLAMNPVNHGGFGQDSVIYQDANQEAYLIDKSGGQVQLGRLEEVNKKEIERLENYTILNGRVYTTVKRN